MASSTDTSGKEDLPFVPGTLISHFGSRPAELQTEGWTALWDTNQNDLWDRGKPSPALIDLLEGEEGKLFIPSRKNDGGRRLRVLVPGCGKGYDVVMLALHGFDVWGLEVSAKGVKTAREYAEMELERISEYNFGEGKGYLGGRGSVKIVQGNFFGKEWEKEVFGEEEERGFEVIYDYTFLCALLPEMRKGWGRRMGELLAPEGVLICLEFPLYKDLKLPGPPWGLREGIYWDLLACGGSGMFGSDEEAQQAMKADKVTEGKLERVARLKPERSYEVSKGTDRLSIWRFKKQA
ncbi:S-adenosyl-L-methionine-dependent methyltransferase [Podospora fimiseda]|uniref:S-adenosyl-L-methionine-dependent methyltransferase n=1 Tax=Podospora fimiseda TaxID=252190 RepID=A0AAN7GWK4_9PEZI|nr:S-adenosyl-L-methionine-dependent methyltransferase [Podospora fimiseda]